MPAPRSRLVVLGLDGLPLALARKLAGTGRLPNLASLAMDRRARPLTAELPELSPVNWTSLATAAGPEEHGVFGFTRISAADYRIGLTDSSCVAVPYVFDRLGERGLVSKALNLPGAYPARPIPGMLVAGFPAPDLARAVHPPFLAGPLAGAGYRLEADTARGATDPDFLLGDLADALASRRRALDLLWPDLAWDLFLFVVTETDRLFHFLFHAVDDPSHPLHAPCLDFLARWDSLVGDVLERYEALPEPKRLMVLADHGFTRLVTEVDVNAWLRRQGLLVTARPPESVTDELDASHVLPATRALALDPGRVYLHHSGRFSRAAQTPGQARGLAREIAQGLMGLTHEGEPVMEAVYEAAELYPGPMLGHAPDLVCLARPGYDLKAKFNRREVFGRFGRTGTHTARDAFFWDSLGAAPERTRDAGREILRHFGLDNSTPTTTVIHAHTL